ncbi:cohesin domain-containing protein [Intestinimonas butyriciproducens]|uniref:cohesin domain-containing protein n=1 Tax=Intestinimonas butyriciproducens TaxID=1297617 RepID=UPI00214BD645|nr:cohesin domain-containing protein [Intestinimonas butyriciproducens]MCR1906008.1 cohesin domain-containing protein [Intestinimonas butyriciproducens]
MKSRKRLLSLFLSLAVMFTMSITTAAAIDADNGSAAIIAVETVKQTVKVGDEVTLNVSVANNPGFAAFDFTIQYDEERLELQGIENGSFGGTLIGNTATGKVNFIANVQNECTGDGTLFTLKFKVKADCSDGTQVKIETTTFKNANNESILSTVVPGGTTGDSTTGDSTTGGSTTGGSTTGGSTTGGSTTGGSTTGGSTTGGSTTGGSTTGGSTTGGSTTGGSTTGGSTTGGSTTGGSTTGGSTTGGSTTGGSTTGGSTTGGSTTGGSTTGGSTTGGSTTGGSTTGGSTTGGGETESIVIDNKTIGVAAASTIYDSENKSLTVTCDQPCVVMIQAADGTLTRLIGTRNSDNTYIFDVSGLPKAAKVVVATKGDANGDGETNAADLALINRAILQGKQIGKFDTMICDVNGDGVVNAADLALMNRQYLRGEQLSWDA